MTGTLDIEQTGGKITIGENEGSALIDRRRAGARGWINTLTGVQGQGVETGSCRTSMFGLFAHAASAAEPINYPNSHQFASMVILQVTNQAMYNDQLLRDDLRQAHQQAWQQISSAGDFWPAAQRISMVLAARAAVDCELCSKRKAALSPAAHSGRHDGAAALPEVVTDFIHRLISDPGRLTKSLFDQVIASGISPAAYVEMISVVTTSVIIDTQHQALGCQLPALLPAQDGEPAGNLNLQAVDAGAWVPVTDAPADVADTGLPSIPNIVRAMGLVPGAVALFFGTFRPHYALRDIPLSISQAQAEFVAARVSALNECFY